MPVQWAQLGAGRTLVASSRGAWLQRPEPTMFSLRGDMPDSIAATPETTRHLLDGAIAVAERAAAPHVRPPVMTRLRWAWQLIGQWYTAHHSVALLPDLIERFSDDGRSDLVDFTRRRAGRGGRARRVRDRQPGGDWIRQRSARGACEPPPPDAAALVDYARACARGETPVEFLGYAYALERRVIRVSPDVIASIDALFDSAVDATAGLRAHAGELDLGHVQEFIAFTTRLPAVDRTRMALGCHRTTEIACAIPPGGDPAEADLADHLEAFRRAVAAAD